MAQRDSISLASIVSKTEKLTSVFPTEKVYLHFDKPYYAIGDTIWFKAYLTVGPKHQPSGLSRVLYVDLLNSQDSVAHSLKLMVINGIAYGDVALISPAFKKGVYHLRAYTNWMRNASPYYFFNKNIIIGDASNNVVMPKISIAKGTKGKDATIDTRLQFKDIDGSPQVDKKVTWQVRNDADVVAKGRGTTDKEGFVTVSFDSKLLSSTGTPSISTLIDMGNKKLVSNTLPLASVLSDYSLQFFPEGGELITGVRSKIAFKAVKADGLGTDVTGSIVDEAGNEVSGFTAQHAGMGIFALMPEAGKSYKANVTFPDGSKKTFDLPRARLSDINLSVNNNDPDNLTIKVATNADYFAKNANKLFYVVAQSGAAVYYTGVTALKSLAYLATVPKDKFPTGLLQLTLFSTNGEPLSERVVFIQHNDQINLSLASNLPSYGSRQLVKMTVSAKEKNLPVEGNFSVAVVDESKVPYDENSETTILSSILLSSDLRGYIEKPNYYFNHPDSKTLADLDVLMLTQGYRRFIYKDILADKYPAVKFLPEEGIEISGTLRLVNGTPVYKGSINLAVPDKNQSFNLITDPVGQFKISSLMIMDPSKVVLSARNNSGYSNMMIMPNVPTVQPVTKIYSSVSEVVNIDSTLKPYLQNSKRQAETTHNLKEVVIKGNRVAPRAKPVHDEYPNLKGLPMEPDQVIGTDQIKNCGMSLADCLLGSAFGLTRAENLFYVRRDYVKGNRTPVQFFVNGLATDDNYVVTMNPADVQSIEVFLKDGMSGLNQLYGTNGIISITTKSGTLTPLPKVDDLPPLTNQGSTITVTPKGFYKARVFYSPVYNASPNGVQVIDLRSTIYWNPNIMTDPTGAATFQYYNADGKGTYKAIIEGIDNDGNIGRYVYRYQVK